MSVKSTHGLFTGLPITECLQETKQRLLLTGREAVIVP